MSQTISTLCHLHCLVSHSQTAFSVLFVVVEKGSGYLTIDFCYRIHRVCAVLIADHKPKDLFNKRYGKSLIDLH